MPYACFGFRFVLFDGCHLIGQTDFKIVHEPYFVNDVHKKKIYKSTGNVKIIKKKSHSNLPYLLIVYNKKLFYSPDEPHI